DGPGRWWWPSGEDGWGTRSSSGSRPISSCWARARWRGSISAWNPPRSSWWTLAPRPLRRRHESSPGPPVRRSVAASVSPRRRITRWVLPDHYGLALEPNSEAIVDPPFDRLREREQLPRGAAVVDQRQRVVAGDPHAAPPVPLRESRTLDEPRRRNLDPAPPAHPADPPRPPHPPRPIPGKRGDRTGPPA